MTFPDRDEVQLERGFARRGRPMTKAESRAAAAAC